MMDKQPEPQWVDTEAIAPRNLSLDEIAALQQTFATPGWRVWLDLRRIEFDAAVDGMAMLKGNEEDRAMNRALYHAFSADLTFEQRLAEHLREKPDVIEEPPQVPERPLKVKFSKRFWQFFGQRVM